MKKILLPLLALLLTVTNVTAQKALVGIKGKIDRGVAVKENPVMNIWQKKAPAKTSRIAMEADERIMGYYTTDDLPSAAEGVGFLNNPGAYQVGVEFYGDVVAPYAGGSITKVRFGLCRPIGKSKITVLMAVGNTLQEVASVDVPSTVAGWNDVTLPSPVPVTDDSDFIIAFDFTQQAGVFPLAMDGGFNSNTVDGGSMVYGDLGQGKGWYTLGGTYGNFCIQAVVKKDIFAKSKDVIVSDLIARRFIANGKECDVEFNVKGSGPLASAYTIDIAVDGNVVKTLDTPVALSSKVQDVSISFELPAGMAKGSHKLTVQVSTIEGEAPLADGMSAGVLAQEFKLVEGGYPHTKHLVEQFTSTYCTYCPLGTTILNKLSAKRDDIALVAVHGNMNGTDIYRTETTDSLIMFEMFNAGGYPSASINRYQIPGEKDIAFGIGINEAYMDPFVEYLDYIIEWTASLPAFASVDISSSFDPETRTANINVSGEALPDFKNWVGEDARLTVFVVEDGLVARQLNNGRWITNYTHNNVLRRGGSSVYGDAINWTGDNKYENSYSFKLDEGWKVENIRIVATIGRPMMLNILSQTSYEMSPIDDAWVNNCNEVKLGGNTASVSGPAVGDKVAVETARYNINGQRISGAQEGLNIIKMSDGTTKKVIVR